MLFYKFESLSHFISSHISSMVLSDSIAKKKMQIRYLALKIREKIRK